MRVVVMGAGVGGLGAALTLSRHGHDVTVLERDATPLPTSAREAFWWDRRGAPQVRHSHALLARLRNLLRDRHPDVLAALLDAGATEWDFIAMLPEGMDRTPHPGDEDLVGLASRRTTFEWTLRRVVAGADHVRLLDGVEVAGLDVTATTRPRVAGVVLANGSTVAADLVVAAGGRRQDVPALLAPHGIAMDEDEADTGIVYYSRFYELAEGAEYPAQLGPIGGDLGYLKYAVFPGDNRTFSITMAARAGDRELRRLLRDPVRFGLAAEGLPATAQHVDGRAEPITEVHVMGSLVNRRRGWVDGHGDPLVGAFAAVGDAHTCTNPLYGRGCTLAMVQAQLLADAVATHESSIDDATAAYEASSEEAVLPWYRAAVAQDAMAAAAASRESSGGSGSGAATGEEHSMQTILRDGLLPAMRSDPVVLRAFVRMFNLLDAPDALLSDPDVMARVLSVYQQRDERPAEEPLGPPRREMLARLSA